MQKKAGDCEGRPSCAAGLYACGDFTVKTFHEFLSEKVFSDPNSK